MAYARHFALGPPWTHDGSQSVREVANSQIRRPVRLLAPTKIKDPLRGSQGTFVQPMVAKAKGSRSKVKSLISGFLVWPSSLGRSLCTVILFPCTPPATTTYPHPLKKVQSQTMISDANMVGIDFEEFLMVKMGAPFFSTREDRR